MQSRRCWLTPDDGTLCWTSNHTQWLCDPLNQKKAGLRQDAIDLIDGLDPAEQEKICVIGMRAGLVRITDSRNRVNVLFFTPRSGVQQVLRSILLAMPKVAHKKFATISLRNLHDNASAEMGLEKFERKMKADETILREDEKFRADIEFSEELNAAVDELLGETRN